VGLHRLTVYFDRWARESDAASSPNGYRADVIESICVAVGTGKTLEIWAAPLEAGGPSASKRLDTVSPLTRFERDEDSLSVTFLSLSRRQADRYITDLLAGYKGGLFGAPQPPAKYQDASWVDSAIAEIGALLADVPAIDSSHAGLGLYALRLLRARALGNAAKEGKTCE